MKKLSGALGVLLGILVTVELAMAAPLAGSQWSPAAESKQFVQFRDDGKLTGHGGCNRFFGSYSETGGTLTIGPLASTKMLCPPDVMKQEQAFFKLLSKVKKRMWTEVGWNCLTRKTSN